VMDGGRQAFFVSTHTAGMARQPLFFRFVLFLFWLEKSASCSTYTPLLYFQIHNDTFFMLLFVAVLCACRVSE
jgi:hypothetical protein